jgi:hypothetical protein
MNNTISYLAGGMLGDFIYSLSVIKEKYIETGKKGVLYLSEKGDIFRLGLEKTFHDTYPLIMNQEYILHYSIYTNEDFDIDLTMWRNNLAVDYKNWYIKYKKTYQIEWGRNKWLSTATNHNFTERIIINTTNYRWPCYLDFTSLYSIYKEKLLFVSFDPTQYNFFREKTGLNIEFYQPTHLIDMCQIIQSCELFIGSQSAPLHIAFAMHKNVVIGKCLEEYSSEHGHHYIEGLEKLFSFVRFTV